jgi:hypothetical protein
MVRTRSQTNLNRIFIDLCTSPELRSKNEHIRNKQRHHLPPLPSLKPMRSNSCSDLTTTSPSFTQTLSLDYKEPETPDVNISRQLSPLGPKQSIASDALTGAPLMPTTSTGFTVQTPSYLTNRSISLFETPTNAAKNSHSLEKSSPVNNKKKTPTVISTPSNDLTQQDYTNRLSDRLKSRGHLRKFFLS